MITLLQMFLIIVIASFTSMANAADNQSPARVENMTSTPITVKAVEKYTVSLLDYVDEDTKKALLGEEIVAFELGLCWEDGYHRHRTEDAKLIEQITEKVRALEIRLDSVSDQAACDAGTELIFVTKDGKKQVIGLNEWRLEIRKDRSYVFYELANDDSLWELCHEVYVHGTKVDY